MKTGALLKRALSGEQLLGSELMQIERDMDRYDNFADILQANTAMGGKELNIPMPFNLIYSTILDIDVASLEITIPSSYRHLLLMGQATVNGTGGAAGAILVYAQINGDTGATNYSVQELHAINTTVNGAQDLTYSGMLFAVVKADAGLANYSGAFHIFFPHYTSGYYKQSIRTMGYFSGLGAQINVSTSLWKSTDPIRSIAIYPDTSTYANAKLEAGSLVSVYGIL